MRLLSLRAAFLKREADMHELPRMNDDAPWESCFQFHPCAVDVLGAYRDGATAILQQLSRKSSEHTFSGPRSYLYDQV
jgi:hypothetical protein